MTCVWKHFCLWLAILMKIAIGSAYKLDVVRDLPPVAGVGGRWRSVVGQVQDVVYESPQVELSSFVHIGCLHFDTSNALAALESCIAIDGAGGSRIDCTGRCGVLTASNVPAVSSSALMRGSECRCCTSDAALGMAAKIARAACDWACADQEEALYDNSAFEDQLQGQIPWSCGGHAENVFSAFRQYDGVSPLGRRGAFSIRYSTWYEVVVLDLPQGFRDTADQLQRWLPFSHFLHAVQVDLGWPVFAHQVPLPFAPECLHVDGTRGRLIALARNRAGGLDAVAICPGCDDSISTGVAALDVIPALEGSDLSLFTALVPGCAFDAERALLEFVAVSKTNPTVAEATLLVEVDIVQRTVSFRSATPLAKAISLDVCRNRGSQHFVALLPGSTGEDFFLSSVDSLAGLSSAAAHALPSCSPSSSKLCASAGPPLDNVQLFASAAHASLPFVFYPTENGTGVGSTHLVQLRCDSSDQPAKLWPSTSPPYHRRRSLPSEAPFNRRGGTGFPVQAPLLKKVEFLNSGRELVATFDGATLMGVKPRDSDGDGMPDMHNENETWPVEFSCTRLISALVVEHLRLENSSCSWISPEKLAVFLDVDSQVKIGDSFFLRPGIVYSYIHGVGYSPPASGGILVSGPSDPRPPELILLGPSVVDRCSDLELDASPSLYVAGRPLFFWRLMNVSCETALFCNTSDIEEIIQLKNHTGAHSLVLEAANRPPELQRITLEVGVESLWGLREFRQFEIEFDGNSYRPTVFVQAVPSRTVPSAGASLKGNVEQSGCFSAPLAFRWKLAAIYSSPQSTSDAAADSLASRAYALWDMTLSRGWESTLLSIPPGALAAGVIYSFELTVHSLSSYMGLSYMGSAAANVSVSAAPLQILFVQPVAVIDSTDATQFDIAPSFDPDNPLEHFPSPTWTCRSITQNACKPHLNNTLALGPPLCAFTQIGSPDLSHVDWLHKDLISSFACRLRPLALAIRPNAFDPGDVAQLSAQVQVDIVKESEQWWVPSGVLTRRAEGLAQLSVRNTSSTRRLRNESVKEPLSAWVAPLQRLSFGSHEPLRLAGYFGPRTNGTNILGDNIEYRWIIERLERNPNYNDEEAIFEGSAYDARVPRSLWRSVQNQHPFRRATSLGTSLALQPRSLTPNARYRFVLQVADSFSNEVAMSTQEVVVVRSRPFVGHFRVVPSSGIASLTLFELSCTQWSADDDALPLVYDFGYVVDFSNGNRINIRLGLPGIGASLRTKYVADSATASQAEFFVDVYTSLGAARRAITFVHIFPGIGSPAWIFSEFARIQEGDPLFVASKVPALLMQNASIERTIIDDDSANYLWNFANESLLLWRKAFEQSCLRNNSAPPTWHPVYMGWVLNALTQALRVIYRYLPKDAIRRDGTDFLQLVLGAASPDPRLPMLSKVRPERFPIPIVHPSASLTDALIRSAADLLLLPRISSFDVDGLGNVTSTQIVQTAHVVAQLFSLLEHLYALLTPYLAPDEAFILDVEHFRFACGRNVNLSHSAHRKASLEAEAAFDVLSPTPWLFVQAQVLPTIGRPAITWKFANLTNFTMQEELRPSIALVAVGGLRDDALQITLDRPEWVSAFGSYWRSLQEAPPALCFQWLSSGRWLREGIVADERGGCRVNLGSGRSSAVIGIFPEPVPLRQDIASAPGIVLEPPPEGGPARILVAFGSLVAIFLVNSCASAISSILRRRRGATESTVITAPPGFPLLVGFRIARFIDDHLVYGSDKDGCGVHWGRSWIRVAMFSHIMLGITSSDQKVTMQHKASVLCAMIIAAFGIVAILSVRLRMRSIFCSGLGGVLSWPLGLLIRFLYEYRLWVPCPQESAESARDREENAQMSVSRVQRRVERMSHHSRRVHVICNDAEVQESRSDEPEVQEPRSDEAEAQGPRSDEVEVQRPRCDVAKVKSITRVSPEDVSEISSTDTIKKHFDATPRIAWGSGPASLHNVGSSIVHQANPGLEPGSLRISSLSFGEAAPIVEEPAPVSSRLVRLPRPRSSPRRRTSLVTAWRDSQNSGFVETENNFSSVVSSSPSQSSLARAQRRSLPLLENDNQNRCALDSLVSAQRRSLSLSGNQMQNSLAVEPPKIRPLQLDVSDERASRRSLMPRNAGTPLWQYRSPGREHSRVAPDASRGSKAPPWYLKPSVGTWCVPTSASVKCSGMQARAAPSVRRISVEPLQLQGTFPRRLVATPRSLAYRTNVAREILSDIAQDASGAGRLAPPSYLPQARCTSCREAEDTFRDSAHRFTMGMSFSAQRFIGDLRYDEQGLMRIRKHTFALKSAHVRTLEHPYVETVRVDLSESVASATLWLAHTATFCITWAGCAAMSVYSPYLFASLAETLNFLLQAFGSCLMIFFLDGLRTGLLTLTELARLETRRRLSQAEWSLKKQRLSDCSSQESRISDVSSDSAATNFVSGISPPANTAEAPRSVDETVVALDTSPPRQLSRRGSTFLSVMPT